MAVERRFINELRADTQGDDLVLQGYASVFGQESQDLGGFREVVNPGTFARSIRQGDDVKALQNHDPNLVLGRSKNGSLQLKEDARGLFFRCVLPPTQTARDLHALVKRGDVDQCSFGFVTKADDWANKRDASGDMYAQRTLHDVDLLDVSAVTYPAYLGTSVAARSLFPDGPVAEIRSALDKLAGAAVLTKRNETRRAARKEKRSTDMSFNETQWAISKALAEKFGYAPSPYPVQNIVDTYDDYVIVCACDNTTWECTYSEVEYEIEDDGSVTLGDLEAVTQEVEWVPTERAKAAIAELRSAAQKRGSDAQPPAAGTTQTLPTPVDPAVKAKWQVAFDAAFEKAKDIKTSTLEAIAWATAEANKAINDDVVGAKPDGHNAAGGTTLPELHSNVSAEKLVRCTMNRDSDLLGDAGDCDDSECGCQNQWVDEGDTWDVDAGDRAAFIAGLEKRASDGKVLTKMVGGKSLTADKFAFVGDKNDTTTWKLPIHDAAHVKNALARFNQTQGLGDAKDKVWNKIKAAAKAFNITVSDDQRNTQQETEAAAFVKAHFGATDAKVGI